ncbi:PepSY-associated TM helix domain-containing protein [Novosphingobium kaempferiae]|uniref:PepSY-associated TM helix domain-containing protein n=1 Tax=Novosphingobium kaempferiae TaxID=2896849 RepID=UPI001E40EB56|nr:PepSY-associated TM helix domain-containing protein [Novosphingobium kaempferiae]
MKVRTDIVRMYKDIHGWVGIISGLALFVAFYAGAITMFEEQLQRWASPPTSLAAPVSLERTPELVRAVLAAHPEAARGYQVNLQAGHDNPARVSWQAAGDGGDEHGARRTFYAALGTDGELQVEEHGPSPVAQFVDVLHQQVGLMLDHEIAMPIMGAIALLYAIALVSGVIVLLPSLVKDLFALRAGKNVKRMWLDVHNLLGVFSLPFHIVMALTAVVFAFHDQFYDAQEATFAQVEERPAVAAAGPAAQTARPVETASPVAVVQSLSREVPGFVPVALAYGQGRDGMPSLRAMGRDPRYGLRGPTYTVAALDPASGAVRDRDYLGGQQDGWGATVTSFFALHFGSFGGTGVRWAYFVLGLGGAFLFYTGNLLWVESRRRRERKAGAVTQTRSTRVLGALTVGVPLGCMAGISVTLAAAKVMGASATEGRHSLVYHVVFAGFVLWALLRGSARGAVELLPVTALAMLSIPFATLLFASVHPAEMVVVDLMAGTAAAALVLAWNATRRRVGNGPRDSVWSDRGPAAQDRVRVMKG